MKPQGFAGASWEWVSPDKSECLLSELHTQLRQHRKIVVAKETPPVTPTKTVVLAERREPPIWAAQNLALPRKFCYFLQGKAAGQAMLYLMDTGCNTELVSKLIFNRLLKHIQNQRVACDDQWRQASMQWSNANTHQSQGCKTGGDLCGELKNEDAILRMLFLAKCDYRMDFTQPIVTIGERELVYTDRFGRLMASHMQTVRKTTIPPQTEVAFSAVWKLIIMLKKKWLRILRANSINQLEAKGNVIVCCINPTNQSLELAAGLTIGIFTSID